MGPIYLIRFVWKLSIQLLFLPFKGAITRTLDLEQYAAYWARWGWLYLSIKWCAAWFFLDQVLPVLRAHARPDLFSALPRTQVENLRAIARFRLPYGAMELSVMRPVFVYQYVDKVNMKIPARKEIKLLSHVFTKAVE